MREYWVNVYDWGLGLPTNSLQECWRRTGPNIKYRLHVKLKEQSAPKYERSYSQAEI